MSLSLYELAESGTDAARTALFGQLCELVTSELDQRTTQELAIFAEVTLALYGNASANDRVQLAQKLSDCPNIPVSLVQRIASDDAKVATPVLASSPVFSQDDLLNLIEALSSMHHEALAQRSDLSSTVSDALAEKGNTPVHKVLAGNRKIKLSRNAMLCLVRTATEDKNVRESLTSRSDLTPTICQKLLPLVNEDEKKRLNTIIQGSFSQEQLDQIARIKALRRELGHALANPDMSLLWSDAQRAGANVDELVTLLLQDQRFNHVIELMALRGRIAQKSYKEAVFSGKLETVLRIAARCGLQPQTFALFVKARCEHLRIPSKKGSSWISAYATHIRELTASKEARGTDFKAKRNKNGAKRVPVMIGQSAMA